MSVRFLPWSRLPGGPAVNLDWYTARVLERLRNRAEEAGRDRDDVAVTCGVDANGVDYLVTVTTAETTRHRQIKLVDTVDVELLDLFERKAWDLYNAIPPRWSGPQPLAAEEKDILMAWRFDERGNPAWFVEFGGDPIVTAMPDVAEALAAVLGRRRLLQSREPPTVTVEFNRRDDAFTIGVGVDQRWEYRQVSSAQIARRPGSGMAMLADAATTALDAIVRAETAVVEAARRATAERKRERREAKKAHPIAPVRTKRGLRFGKDAP